jgi:hypothetical protein
MTAYTIPCAQTISSDVAALRKIIERARKLERDSYKAMMQKKRQLQVKVKDLFPAEL